MMARVVAAVLLFVAMSLPLRAQQTDRAKALGKKLMCVCGCAQILTSCNHVNCGFSHPMLQQLDERVARNDPDDLVLQGFVQEYGGTVLAEPPARGFNRATYIVPIFLPLAGLLLTWVLVTRWRQRAAAIPAAKVSDVMLARARHDLDREDD
ncbi:MAG: cytochrome c-type biogenesis protein [Candidatus Acidiferrales bacterium]